MAWTLPTFLDRERDDAIVDLLKGDT